MSVTTRSGFSVRVISSREVPLSAVAGDLEPGGLDDEHQPLAQEGLVLGDHRAHGTSAIDPVP